MMYIFWKKYWNNLTLSNNQTEELKDRIRQRLATEDYTCRLPNPRYRYKLTLQLKGHWDGEKEFWERVWC